MGSVLTRRLSRKTAMALSLLAALTAGWGLFMSGCAPRADQKEKPPVAADAAGGVGSGCAPASDPVAKSPKELALADFLKAVRLEGKPVLIEFGMIGCALSEEGLDNMIALQKANTVSGLAFVRVEDTPDAAAVDAYYATKAPSFPVYRDSQSALAKALSATAYPTFVLADKFGHIRYKGKYPQENLVSWGNALVAEARDPGRNVPQFGARELDVTKLLASKLPDLQGQARAPREYIGEGGLMLLFVDTNCPFSATALKEMPAASKALAAQKVSAVVLNNDDAQTRVQGFYANHDTGAPVLYDTGAATREDWNVHSVPIAVYISPGMTVGYQGEAIWANVGSAIEQSLGLAAGTIKFGVTGTGFG